MSGPCRWFLNGLAALSLLLLAAMAVAWVRSYYGVDEMFYDREVFVHHNDGGGLSAEYHYWIAMSPSRVTLYGEVESPSEVWDGPQENQASWHIGVAHDKNLATGTFEANGLDASLVKRRFGFTYDSEFGGHFWLLGVPLWVMVGITAILPSIRCARRLGYFRGKPNGFCPSCRYNLSGNVSGVCPECGTVVPGKSATGPSS